MGSVFSIIVSLSLSGSIIFGLLQITKPFTRKCFTYKWQYYIGAVVLLRLLVPVSSGINIVGAVLQRVSTGAIASAQAGNRLLPEQFHCFLANQMWIVWISVALALFVWKLNAYHCAVKNTLLSAHPVNDPQVLAIYIEASKNQRIKKPPLLLYNKYVPSPMAIGIVRPSIILPTVEMDIEQLQMVLRHELVHHKRWDVIYKWAVQIAVCLHWFNPLVYWYKNEINRSCELSCDEALLKRMGPQEKELYGHTLLNSVSINSGRKDIVSITLNGETKFIKSRLHAILVFRQRSGASKAVSIAAAFVAIAIALMFGCYPPSL